jgi:hypothetical protein
MGTGNIIGMYGSGLNGPSGVQILGGNGLGNGMQNPVGSVPTAIRVIPAYPTYSIYGSQAQGQMFPSNAFVVMHRPNLNQGPAQEQNNEAIIAQPQQTIPEALNIPAPTENKEQPTVATDVNSAPPSEQPSVSQLPIPPAEANSAPQTEQTPAPQTPTTPSEVDSQQKTPESIPMPEIPKIPTDTPQQESVSTIPEMTKPAEQAIPTQTEQTPQASPAVAPVGTENTPPAVPAATQPTANV